jgi:ATP-binding cassette subfamily F protein uup
MLCGFQNPPFLFHPLFHPAVPLHPMSTFLSVENLSRALGERILFENLTFGIQKGDRTALVARNGRGKSTILRMLAGKEMPDRGQVMVRNGIKVGYLEQEPDLHEPVSIAAYLAQGHTDEMRAARAYEDALHKLTVLDSPETQRAFERASAEMDRLQAWDFEQRMATVLGKLDIHDLEKPLNVLSGGERKRVALAFVLLEDPDLLILDEPTNHLDVDMIEWLEKYLSRSTTTLFMVTHDRYFLDRVCNQILEMDRGKLFVHRGNYGYYLEKKAEREEIEQVDHGKLVQLYKKELAWMRRGPKARTTKSKSRIDQFFEIEEKVSDKKEEGNLSLSVKWSRMGSHILDLEHISKKFGEKVILNDFNYSFQKGERIGIVGANGTGKSTFLKIITGELKPDSGDVKTGETIVYGHFKQSGIDAKPGTRAIDLVKEVAEVIPLANGKMLSASQFLEHFLFGPDLQYTPVNKLSGGERRRLGLMMTLIKNPNFLILDEPTNDLDLETMNRLEEFLLGYGGCLLLVTHDRFILDKLVDHLFVFEGNGRVTDYGGSYSGWKIETAELEEKAKKPVKAEQKPVITQKPVEAKRKRTSNENKEFGKLASEIEKLEAEKTALEAKLGSGTGDPASIRKDSERYGQVQELLDEKTMRWLELDDLGG